MSVFNLDILLSLTVLQVDNDVKFRPQMLSLRNRGENLRYDAYVSSDWLCWFKFISGQDHVRRYVCCKMDADVIKTEI